MSAMMRAANGLRVEEPFRICSQANSKRDCVWEFETNHNFMFMVKKFLFSQPMGKLDANAGWLRRCSRVQTGESLSRTDTNGRSTTANLFLVYRNVSSTMTVALFTSTNRYPRQNI